MLPDNVLRKELLDEMRSKKGLAIKMLMPLVFIIPFLVDGVPASVRASMLPLAALFLGVFGSSIGLVRMKEGKMLPRLRALPVSPMALFGGYLLANVLINLVQLTLPFLVVLATGNGDLWMSMVAMVCLISAVVGANSFGLMIASASGSSGEIHLYSAVSVLALGAISGLFMVPPSMMLWVSELSPFYSLSCSVQAVMGIPMTNIWLMAPLTGGALMLLALSICSSTYSRAGLSRI